MSLTNAEKQKAYRDRQKELFSKVLTERSIEQILEQMYDLHDCLVYTITQIEKMKEFQK